MNNSEENQSAEDQIKREMIKELVRVVADQNGGEILFRTQEIDKSTKPHDVKVSGSIDSVSRWLISRKDTFNPLESHAIANIDERKISLVINETNSNGKRFEIVGKLEESKVFQDLGINKSCVSYSPQELANRLKLLRSIFPKGSDHAMIVSTLRNLKAKINKQLEDADDKRGNVTKSFEQSVESNMPEQFEICIPLLKGEPARTFFVNVLLEAHVHDIKCYLESVDAAELIDKISEERISKEVEKIEELTTVIFQ